ncbi:unnamed protein product [Lymnaea stagnalis]|uniref:Chitin-binding type-2 domain-containing protein n=1 Tax=Lymnaea stagnalis TaxID=6523 RepID=A0AAV2I3M7_LYMST
MMARLGLVPICLIFNLIQVSAVDYDAVCETPKCEKSGQVFPNCQDCSSYLKCSAAGGLKKRVPCPSGQYFDAQSKRCGRSSSSCPRPSVAKFPEIRGWGNQNSPPSSPPSSLPSIPPPELDEYPDFLAQMSYKGQPSAVVRYVPEVGELGANGKVLDKFFSEKVVKSDDKRLATLIKSPAFQKLYAYSRLQ